MTDLTSPNTEGFAVFGLYRDKSNPQIILATDKADALRQYHDRFPGWDGTTFRVLSVEEMAEGTDD